MFINEVFGSFGVEQLVSINELRKNKIISMDMLQDSVAERSGKRLCLEKYSVKNLGRGVGWSNFALS